jgi:hypothetical protein
MTTEIEDEGACHVFELEGVSSFAEGPKLSDFVKSC